MINHQLEENKQECRLTMCFAMHIRQNFETLGEAIEGKLFCLIPTLGEKLL